MNSSELEKGGEWFGGLEREKAREKEGGIGGGRL